MTLGLICMTTTRKLDKVGKGWAGAIEFGVAAGAWLRHEGSGVRAPLKDESRPGRTPEPHEFPEIQTSLQVPGTG